MLCDHSWSDSALMKIFKRKPREVKNVHVHCCIILVLLSECTFGCCFRHARHVYNNILYYPKVSIVELEADRAIISEACSFVNKK